MKSRESNIAGHHLLFMLFHGHFNKLGGNTLESRITLKDLKVVEIGGAYEGKAT